MTDMPPLCPNCRIPWPAAAEFCPNCGLQRPPPPSGASWPPPPSNFTLPVPPLPVPKLVTGRAWGDITLGAGLTMASSFVYCLGLVVMPVLYFMLKPNYPVFARGIGYGLVVDLLLLLGAFIWCFAGAGWGAL